jgi:hypothetical protein
MSYAHPLEGKAWGAGLPESPVMPNPGFRRILQISARTDACDGTAQGVTIWRNR